jgi:hypothetical protein
MKNLSKLFLLLAAVILITLAFPHPAAAAPQTDSRTVIGESYTLENGRILKGNLIVIGGVVEIQEEAIVDGDTFVLGGLVTIDGTIKGDLTAVGGTVNINRSALIEGDLNVPASYLSIDPDASVLGEQRQDWVIPGVDVEQFTTVRPPILRTRSFALLPILTKIGQALVSTLVIVALGALLLLILPKPVERMTNAVVAFPWHMLGYGALSAFVMVGGGLIMIITICMIPVAFLVGMVFGLAVLVGWLALGYELGKRIATSLFKTTWHPVLSAALGNLVLYLVAQGINLIPCIGWFPVFITLLIGLGMTVTTLFGTYHYPRTDEKDQDQAPVVLFERSDAADSPAEVLSEDLLLTPEIPQPEVPIEALGLGSRITSILKDAGLNTVNAVQTQLETGEDTLLAISGFGPKALSDLKAALTQHGYEI